MSIRAAPIGCPDPSTSLPLTRAGSPNARLVSFGLLFAPRASKLARSRATRDARLPFATAPLAMTTVQPPDTVRLPAASSAATCSVWRPFRYRARCERHREPGGLWARHNCDVRQFAGGLDAVGRDRSRGRAIDQRKQPAHPASRIGRRHLDCLRPFEEGAVARRRADGCAKHRCCVVCQTNTRSPDDEASTWSRRDAGSSFARPSAADAKKDAPNAQPGSRDGVVRVQWIRGGRISDLRALLPVGNAGLKRVHPRLEHGNVVVEPVDQAGSRRVADPSRAIQRVVPNGQPSGAPNIQPAKVPAGT